MRLIDADAMKNHYSWWGDTEQRRTFDAIADVQPTVTDVAPVRHGRWVYGENEGQDGWYCSECHFFIPWYYDWYGLDNIDFIKDFHACPHCSAKMVTYTGAKMDGGDGDD